MNENIDAITKIMCGTCSTKCEDTSGCLCETYAKLIYDAGYRKQEWFDAKTNPPTESGEVLVFTKSGFHMILNYSVRHKAFNAFDDFEDAERAIEVTHWMPLLPDPKGE